MTNQEIRPTQQRVLKVSLYRALLSLSIAVWFSGSIALGDPKSEDIESRYLSALELAHGLNGVEKDRRGAIAILKDLAQEGDATSQNLLGSLYTEEASNARNFRKANEWFQKSAEQNNPYAQYNLAFSYRIGRGVARDDSVAERYFKMVVAPEKAHTVTAEDYHLYRQTIAATHYQLGGIYSDYSSGLRDFEKSVESMELAEAGGVPMAALYLATQYALGEQIERDTEKAEYYLGRYPLLAANEFRLYARSKFYEGMDHEETSTMAEIADKLQDEIAEQTTAMQTSFGASLLKPGETYNPEMARRWLEIADSEENFSAKLMLSRIYYHGLGTDRDLEKARTLLKAASARYSIAKFNYGVMLMKGEGGLVDEEEGRKSIQAAAKDNLYVACRYLINGDGLREYSPEEALDECLINSDAGDRAAQYCLGFRHLFGLGLPKDVNYARDLIESSAEGGFAPAQYLLGTSFPTMMDKLGNAAKMKWIEQSASQGYLPAKLYLGRESERQGTPDAYQKAAQVYQECAYEGMPEAMIYLGQLYLKGRGVKRDDATAHAWFQKAADLKSIDAYRILGEAYRDGIGVPEDIESAKYWFEKGALANNVYSQFDLARLIAASDEEDSWEKALPWFEKAAKKGHYDSMYELAECYRLGRGVAKSRILAFDWYSDASKGSRGLEAMYEYARLALEPDWSQSDPEAAETVFHMLENQGFTLAKFELAKIFAQDKGNRKNLKKAYSRFRKVAEYRYVDYDQVFGKNVRKAVGRAKPVRFKPILVESRRKEVENAAIESALWLARMTELGEGVRANQNISLGWYRVAAEAGNSIAQYELAVRLQEKQMSDRTGFDFVQWLKLSADSGYSDAQFEVGRLHFSGSQQALDRESSINYLKKAAEQDHQEAKALLRSEKIEYESKPIRKAKEDESELEEIWNSPLMG